MAAAGDGARKKSPSVLLEVWPSSVSGDLAPGMPTLEQFRRRAHEIADSVAEVAEEFRSRLQKVLRRPEDPGWHADSIELDFQIAVQAEAGVVVARAVSGATFTVKLTLKASAEQQ
jgi:NTP-dependent ternary system trypsin peptidase co-occuring protein